MIVSVTGSQMQFVAITGSLLSQYPRLLRSGRTLSRSADHPCSLAGGVVADAIDRKKLMIVTQTIMLTSAALLTANTLAGMESVWPIYILSSFASAASAFEVPARQALMPTLVPAEDFPNAVSFGILVFHVATICGPAIAGFMLAESGPAVIYGINALSFVAVMTALVLMREWQARFTE